MSRRKAARAVVATVPGSPGLVQFYCPGCKSSHQVRVGGVPGAWKWNFDVVRPTFAPSILARSGHFIPEHKGACWCDYKREHPEEPVSFACANCHSYIREGQIEFLSDCSHDLRGTVHSLPEWPHKTGIAQERP